MDAFIGEIRPFAFGWAPENWLLCNGQSVSVNQYQALYAIISTLYGNKDGAGTFQLPNVQGFALMGSGQSQVSGNTYNIPQTGGVESFTLDYSNMAVHNHTFSGGGGGGTHRVTTPPNNSTDYYLTNIAYTPSGGSITGVSGFVPAPLTANTYLNPQTISMAGGNPTKSYTTDPHENRQPYLAIGYYICTYGEFPVPNN